MLDIRTIRKNAARVQEASQQKGYPVDIGELLRLDDERRGVMVQVEAMRQQRNQIAAQMKDGKPSPALIETSKQIKTELASQETRLEALEQACESLQKRIPNLPLDDVPVGVNESENVVTRIDGQLPEFGFEAKNHWQIAEARGWIDKERASKVTGSRFAYLKGELVLLQMAIVQYVLNTLGDANILKKIAGDAGLEISTKPFTPVLPPLMIRTALYDAMDRLEPSDDRYKIEGEELWLQGSAEHVLGSMHANEILDEAALPIRYIGYASSFRKEAGTYGRDMEGIIRMHQFDKLEMESFSTQESGKDEHLLFVAIQEYLLQQLGLPYRVLLKCTADIGKPNARGVDIETWLPGQNQYRETHTADYMTDYQARRLKTRVRRETGDIELIHTNDATAFALGRIMVAIIENYQTNSGKVEVPPVLQPYLGGRIIL
ncbi:serine--tRNA ligase [Paraburkholderia bannensis]|uniref:serine--tRNA ligase n=1 Tax=Paraburkholderia bannensis TaxID=765414 RepID=UPI002AB2A1E0|nr:serine--tRNA ligase [Paraburkholderia bannensis]